MEVGVDVSAGVLVGEEVDVGVDELVDVLVGTGMDVGVSEGVTVGVADRVGKGVEAVVASGAARPEAPIPPSATTAGEPDAVLIRPTLRQARASGNTKYQPATSATTTQHTRRRSGRDRRARRRSGAATVSEAEPLAGTAPICRRSIGCGRQNSRQAAQPAR
jgi:hypothetical protein